MKNVTRVGETATYQSGTTGEEIIVVKTREKFLMDLFSKDHIQGVVDHVSIRAAEHFQEGQQIIDLVCAASDSTPGVIFDEMNISFREEI